MLRRAVRSMRLLGWRRAGDAAPAAGVDGADERPYPELRTDFERISQVAYSEEEAFRRTLASGTTILDTAVARVKSAGRDRPQRADRVAGVRAARHLRLPHRPHPGDGGRARASPSTRPGFRRLMQEQQDRARADARRARAGARRHLGIPRIADGLGRAVEFTGYDEVVSEGRVARDRPRRREGRGRRARRRHRAGPGPHPVLRRGRRPAGRRRPDRAGQRRRHRGARRAVARSAGLSRTGRPWSSARSSRDAWPSPRSTSSAASRSPARTPGRTWCTRRFARPSATPRPRRVRRTRPAGFRFDFNAQSAVPKSVLRDVEAKVNALLLDDLPVTAEVMTQRQARDAGAMALFGEKYGDAVRVVSVGDWARELCGGTHAQRSGQLGVGQAARRVVDRLRRAAGGGAGGRRRLLVPRPRARDRRRS